jgi:uncharacterized protein (TIGR00299 family) protein
MDANLHLHIDCRAGMAGDMFLAAFAHLGVDLAPLESLFREAGLDISLETREENRSAGMGRRVDIRAPDAQPLRHLADLTAIVQRLACPQAVRDRSIAALARLAEAEAEAHGCRVEEIHFHEVGAADTLADVVGTFWALDRLGATRVTSTPLPWFSGTVECEHGVIPLPAPAVLALIRGLPVFPTEETTELITPTGALIGSCLIREYAPETGAFSGPHGQLVACGTGYGSRPAPRGLRLFLLRGGNSPHMEHDVVMQIETHLDHLTGEELAHAMEGIMASGALDVLWLPGIMKKGRPGGALRALCREEHLETVRSAVFRHTHTLGLREIRLARTLLPRRGGSAVVDGECLSAKVYTLDGTEYARPEYEAMARRARSTGGSIANLRLGGSKAE